MKIFSELHVLYTLFIYWSKISFQLPVTDTSNDWQEQGSLQETTPKVCTEVKKLSTLSQLILKQHGIKTLFIHPKLIQQLNSFMTTWCKILLLVLCCCWIAGAASVIGHFLFFICSLLPAPLLFVLWIWLKSAWE